MAIKAGIVIVNQYCKPDSKIYSGYIKYMDREKAVRTEHVAEFDMFNEYMGNPEKTTGLFMNGKYSMTKEEIREAKRLFEVAQSNGSYMWQTVISFDNLWLEKNGLYDSVSKTLNEDKVKELAMNGVNKMLRNEKLDQAVWTAAIHYNTDNIHIHIATVEVEPMREKRVYQQFVYKENDKKRLVKDGMVVDLNGNPVYKEEMKGKFSVKSFELGKQYIVNEIIREKDLNKEINGIIRDRMARMVRNNEVFKDPEIARKVNELYAKLPDCSRNMWNYGNNIMKPLRADLDEISRYYLEHYKKEDYEELLRLLDRQSEMYQTAYGESYSDCDFKESKLQDLYKRMGNSILKAVKELDLEDKMSERLNEQHEMQDEEDNITENGKEEAEFLQQIFDEAGVINEDITEEYVDGKTDQDSDLEKKNKYFLSWNKEYKATKSEVQEYMLFGKEDMKASAEKNIETLQAMANEGHVLALYDLGKWYSSEQFWCTDEEIARSYMEEAYQGFSSVLEKASSSDHALTEKEKKERKFHQDYAHFRLGQMESRGIGTKVNLESASEHFEKSDMSFAKYALGELYYEGKGVEQDYLKAAKCYEDALKYKVASPYAAYRLGEMYEHGKGLEVDLKKSKEYYLKAFKMLNDLDSDKRPDMYIKYRIGVMYFYGKGVEKNLEKAFEYLEASRKLGNDNVYYMLGCIYMDSEFKGFNMDKAVEYLEKAAEKENSFALCKLGSIYLDENSRYYDFEKGIKCLEEAVLLENDNALYKLGRIYVDQNKTCYDLEKGMHYLKEAAQHENQYAQYKLGCIYTNPDSGLYDLKKGIRYFEQAAEQGNAYAQYRLGSLYADQDKEIYDLEKGVEYLEQAAMQGNVYVLYKLGSIYIDPNVPFHDMEKGIKYLKEAAQHENQYAQYKLGCIYTDPDSELYDLKEGVRYFEQAAQQGNAYAQYRFGCLYADPDKEIYDLEKGIKYLEQSAKQGNVYAECKLGDVFFYQKKDMGEGIKWYKSASEKGNTYAKKQLIKIELGIIRSSSRSVIQKNWEFEKAIRALKKSFEKDFRAWKNVLEHDRELEKRLNDELSW